MISTKWAWHIFLTPGSLSPQFIRYQTWKLDTKYIHKDILDYESVLLFKLELLLESTDINWICSHKKNKYGKLDPQCIDAHLLIQTYKNKVYISITSRQNRTYNSTILVKRPKTQSSTLEYMGLGSKVVFVYSYRSP